MAQVLLKKVNKVYPGNIHVVIDADLKINDKEFMVLVGPSGCGKSTTLRMIAGLEEITEGEILIDGKVVNQVAPKDRDIAMVFQNYALYPHMTVYENLAFGLRLRKFSKEEISARVDEAAAILGLEEYLERKPKALSGGQRQRVAVGRAIVRKPKVFLFDEPLSNLDAKLRVQMRAEINKLHQKLETTMIYVTHDQTEAMTMGDRITVLKDGIIQQVDTPLNLYDHPVNMFVAGFMGSPSMNFIRGEINQVGAFVSNGVQIAIPEKYSSAMIVYKGKKVILGVRPEHLTLATDGSIQAKVEVVEPMGNEIFIHCVVGDVKFLARINTRKLPTPGDILSFDLVPEYVHFFDVESELSITYEYEK